MTIEDELIQPFVFIEAMIGCGFRSFYFSTKWTFMQCL